MTPISPLALSLTFKVWLLQVYLLTTFLFMLGLRILLLPFDTARGEGGGDWETMILKAFAGLEKVRRHVV